MPLLLRDRAHFICERERLPKIGERKRARDVMAVHDLPLRDLLRQIFKFLPGQRWDSALARHACFARKIAHDSVLQISDLVSNSTRTSPWEVAAQEKTQRIAR